MKVVLYKLDNPSEDLGWFRKVIDSDDFNEICGYYGHIYYDIVDEGDDPNLVQSVKEFYRPVSECAEVLFNLTVKLFSKIQK